MLDSKTMYVIDENGKEVAMEILFTFENEEKGKKYVLFTDPNKEDGETFASCYDDEGNLSPIETEEEWAMVEEVLGAFVEEEENGSR